MQRFDRALARSTPIAIVGMACRLPGASTLDELWSVLERMERRIEPLPRERWDPEFDAANLPASVDPRACEQGGTLPELELDWRTLRTPPAQAQRMHRMELAALGAMAEALRDGGIEPSGSAWPRARVFIASNTLSPDPRVDHGRRIRRFELHEPVRRALAELESNDAASLERAIIQAFEDSAPAIEPDSMMTSASIVAGRLTNIFNLQGGHLAIDAGVASSLAALREAINSLRLGECDHALVCGVSSLVGPPALLAAAHRGLLGVRAPRPFAPGAEGSALAEGALAVLLARPEAIGDRPVHAWIEAIGSAPITEAGAHEAVALAVGEALAAARIEPAQVRFVESRALGVHEHDQAEAYGLALGYRTSVRPDRPLALGSTVANFGFLGASAGMLALIKAALCLRRGVWLGQLDGQIDDEELELRAGLTLARGRVPMQPGERVGISDAGIDPLAFHALLTDSRAHVASKLPAPRLTSRKQPIAIVGMGLRVPGARDVDEFWTKALAQIDAIGDMPPARWDVDLVVGSDPGVATVLRTRLAATIATPQLDDDPRWAVVEHEREHLDPAVVLALLTSAEALRDLQDSLAKLDPRRIGVVFGQLPLRARQIEAEKRSLFAVQLALTARTLRRQGCSPERVAAVLAMARRIFDSDLRIGARPLGVHGFDNHSGLACSHRVAAAFGFAGPVLSVDAACASALAAVHVGINSLLLGDTDLVLAGGLAFNLLPEYYIALSVLGALSARGAPPFTRYADGFVPGEGGGVVALRRLEDAQRDGDRIHAVIEGVGFGSDGRGVSIFAPNPAGERRAITRALADAGLRPSAVDYVEAHGTGTRLGDETELGSVIRIYGRRDRARPLSLSSVKSQVGHLSSAAGVVGLVKAALALRERVIPSGCGEGEPLPGFANSHVALADRPRPWISAGSRYVGVSSFGLGGANYHLILGEPTPSAREDRPELEHPRPPPVREQQADRFLVELVPLERPLRAPAYPLAGKRLLLLSDPSGLVCDAVEKELNARGASVGRIEPEDLDADAIVDQALATFYGTGQNCVGIIDLRAFAPPIRGDLEFLDQLDQFNRVTFTLLSTIYGTFEQPGCSYVAVTAMGGDLGLMGGEAGSLLGAQLLGLVKGLKQELPQLQAKAIDFDRAIDPDELAKVVLDELEDGNDRVEVGWAGRRFVTNLQRRNFAPDEAVVRRLGPGDVFVFSGGSRGVVFECALALAQLGVQVVISGRTEPPDPNAAWVGLDDEGFEGFRRKLLEQRRSADPRLTPVAFAREFARYQQQRELHRNLLRARALGVPLVYEVCDVMDRESVRAMIDRVRERYGRIDGVGHGAMVEWSRSLPNKNHEIIHKTTMVKVAGLLHLIDATRTDELEIFVAFGSGAGRFGNRGQTDYSAANALMATALRAKSRSLLEHTHCVTIDWTAWREVGAAADDPDLAARVRETGVSSVSVEEGVWHFVNEVFLGDAHEVVIFSEDMQWKWFGLGSQGEGSGERRKWTDDRGAPLVPGEWPMLDRAGTLVDRKGRPTIAFHRRLDVRLDHFLAEHLLHDAPILPGTFGCELIAEGAAISAPGWHVESLESYEIGAPAKLGSNGMLDLRGEIVVLEQGPDRRLLEITTRSDLVLRGHTLQSDRLHHRAKVVLRKGERGPLRTELTPPVDDGGLLRSRSVFALSSDPVLLGPQFLRGQWIRTSEDEVIGTIRPPRERAIMSRSAMPQFQLDPMVLDTAFQIAANWDGIVNRWVSVPMGVGRIRLGARVRRAGEVTRVRAKVERVVDPDVFYSLVVFGDDDEPLLAVEGMWLRRAGRIAPELLGLIEEEAPSEPRLREASG